MSRDKDKNAKQGTLMPEMDNVTIKDDSGGEISFRGRIYDQTSFYDEDSGVLTKQRLYATDDGREAFSIVSSSGQTKTRRAYLLERKNGMCEISNGSASMTLPMDSLMLYTQILWDLDIDRQRSDAGLDLDSQDLSINE